MAHIFKRPESGNKGILVFTHKEIAYFFRATRPLLRRDPRTYLPYAFNLAQVTLFRRKQYVREFALLRERFFIGVHFGWVHRACAELEFVDFYMSGPGTTEFDSPDGVMHIPMNSRNFISSEFTDLGYTQKFWDIICVARIVRFKNLDLLLRAVKRMNDAAGHPHKLLLVIPPNQNPKPDKFYTEIVEDYLNWFDEDERANITLMKLSEDLSFMGMPQKTLVHLYNASRVFTLFSQEEGESRVITEALLCGLPVVAKSDLRGGGRDFLDETNSVLFDSYEDAHIALKRALDQHESLQAAPTIRKNLREDYTVPELKGWFSKLYSQHGLNFDGELINADSLDLRLPGHHHDVAWNRGRFQTADILTDSQFEIFKQNL